MSTRKDAGAKDYRPSSVKVGGYEYLIAPVDMTDAVSENFFGRTHPNKKRIEVDFDNWDHVIVRSTLLHEVLHALLYEAHLSVELSEKDEEELVTRLGNIMADSMVYSPQTWHWILHNKKMPR